MRRRAAVLAAVLLAGLATAGGPPSGVAAAEYQLVTEALYEVDPEEGRITVTVTIAFTNTYTAPSGQVSVFREIRLGIHEHATSLNAGDTAGPLTVSAAASEGLTVATVQLRSPIETNQSAQLTLSYELRDGDDPLIRIGPHLVTVPVWGFGTQSRVLVDIPADFEVRVDGDPLEATVADDRAILDSGPIADPTRWLAEVGATRQPRYLTLQEAVPLDGGTVDLQVRYWADDPDWGTATLDLLVDALPRLEAIFGLPYDRSRPLVVSESVGGRGFDPRPMDGGLEVGFGEPPFTVLHQVAHLWASDELAADRWIREGLASWAAERVGREIEVAPPYDPTAVAADLGDHAFPLVEWGAEPLTPEASGWAYAAAWALVDEATAAAGDDALRVALARIAGGLDGYDALDVPPGAPDGTAAEPVDSRAFLDHLDVVTEAAVVEALAAPVLGGGAEAELAARAEARTAHGALLQAAGPWGDPGPVRAAMLEWRFDDARAGIAAAAEWLVERDRLLREIDRAGLQAPDRLVAAYAVHGGGAEAWAEIEAERAVVAAFRETSGALAEGFGPIEHVGLGLGPEPQARLAAAAGAFAEGDLRAAADTVTKLMEDVENAAVVGLIRILSVVVAGGTAVVLASLALRRRRPATDYTPAP